MRREGVEALCTSVLSDPCGARRETATEGEMAAQEQQSTGAWARGFLVKQSNSSEAETGEHSLWDLDLELDAASATAPPPPKRKKAAPKKAAPSKLGPKARAVQKGLYAEPDAQRDDAQHDVAESRISEAEEGRQLVVLEGSTASQDAHPCAVCAEGFYDDDGDKLVGVRVRLIERTEVVCSRCVCLLNLDDNCANRAKRGLAFGACGSCYGLLEDRVRSLSNKKRLAGASLLKMLLDRGAAACPLRDLQRKVMNVDFTYAQIQSTHGRDGLARRALAMGALRLKSPDVATALAVPVSWRKSTKFTQAKGGHGLSPKDIWRSSNSPSLGGRLSVHTLTRGTGALGDVEATTGKVVEILREVDDDTSEKSPSELLEGLEAADAAERLGGSAAHSVSARTRRSAPRKAALAQERRLLQVAQRAALEASRSDEDRARLDEHREWSQLYRQGVSMASVTGGTPKNGEATIDNYRQVQHDQAKNHRQRAKKLRKDERDATGKDHVTAAVDRESLRLARRAASKKRARDDPGSCLTYYCTNDKCGLYNKPKSYGSIPPKYLKCYQCGHGVTFA